MQKEVLLEADRSFALELKRMLNGRRLIKELGLTLNIFSEQIHKQNLCICPSATRALTDPLFLLCEV